MPFRTTLWLALALVGLTAYLFLVEFPRERAKQASEESSKKVFQIDPAAVQSVTLQYPEFQVLLTRTGEAAWRMDEPLAAETDHREVEGLVATIAEMERVRTVSKKDEQPAAFGFAPPPLTIRLEMEGGAEEVILGDDGPIADTMYVKRGSTQEVALTRQWIRGALSRTVFDLRNKSVLSLDRNLIEGLTLSLPEARFRFEKEDGRWMMREPRSLPADGDRIDGLLGTLVNLRAIGFVDAPDQKRDLRGKFRKAALRVELAAAEDGRNVEFFRAPDPGNAYAVVSPEAPLFEIPGSILEDFKTDLFYYQDKHLLSMDRGTAVRVEVQTPEESYTLRKDGEQWTLEGETGPVNPEEAGRFLDRLEELVAEQKPAKAVTPKKAGLDPPRWRIAWNGAGTGTGGELAVGDETEEGLYARGRTDLETVLIRRNFTDQIPRKSEIMKTREDAPPAAP